MHNLEVTIQNEKYYQGKHSQRSFAVNFYEDIQFFTIHINKDIHFFLLAIAQLTTAMFKKQIQLFNSNCGLKIVS